MTTLLKVLDETADYLVVDKPAGCLVHPTRPDNERTLWHALRELLAYELATGGSISIINRLDRETSGVTVVAKHREAARTLGMAIAARGFSKCYLALVRGWPAQDAWTVDAPIARQGDFQPSAIWLKRFVHPEGAASVTHFEVLRRWEQPSGLQLALVRCRPETGRIHQIRIHLAYGGHPVLGDKIYGPREGCYLDFIKSDWTPELAAELILPRHALHCVGMGVRYEGVERAWASPLPPDLAALLPPASDDAPPEVRHDGEHRPHGEPPSV